MRSLFRVLFIISVVFISITYAYEVEKGKIDTHGGKGDSLTSGKAFGMAIGLGTVLNKKGLSEDNNKEKENKKFIALDKQDKIEEIK